MQGVVEVRAVLWCIFGQAMVVFYPDAEVSCCEVVVDFVELLVIDGHLGVSFRVIGWACSDCGIAVSMLGTVRE